LFQPGQYIGLTLPHAHPDSRGSARTFTIASAPGEPLVQITTRLSTSPSTFKQALCSLSPGSVVEASSPGGQFVYTDAARPAVFIAGGIGITPFRAILSDLAAGHLPYAATTLLYSSASSEIPFRAFLDSLLPGWPGLRIAYTLTHIGVDTARIRQEGFPGYETTPAPASAAARLA
jgi:ferredoxin-NADP reductase